MRHNTTLTFFQEKMHKLIGDATNDQLFFNIDLRLFRQLDNLYHTGYIRIVSNMIKRLDEQLKIKINR